MTRKTEFGVSWKRGDSKLVTEAMDLEAEVSGTTRKLQEKTRSMTWDLFLMTVPSLLISFCVMKRWLVACDAGKGYGCTACYKSWNSGSLSPTAVFGIHVYIVTVSHACVLCVSIHNTCWHLPVSVGVYFGGERKSSIWQKFDVAVNFHHIADVNRAGAASVVFNVSEEELISFAESHAVVLLN